MIKDLKMKTENAFDKAYENWIKSNDPFLIEAKKDYGDALLLKKSTALWKSDNFQHEILSRLYSMMSSWTSLEEIAAQFLTLVAELCEVPMAAIALLEHDGPHAYYISANTLGEAEVNDFFAVNIQPDIATTAKQIDECVYVFWKQW